MKLAGTIALLILLTAIVNCIPSYDLDGTARVKNNYLEELYNLQQQDTQKNVMMGVQEDEMEDTPDEMKDYPDEMEDYPNDKMEDDYQYNSQQPQELEEYDGEEPSDASEIAVTQSRNIRSGDTVALQTFDRFQYLSCSPTPCGRSSCPNMCFDGKDWNNCWGEVFQIYRQKGPGCLQVGDRVGLHYPREAGSWLGCPDKHCAKSRCPCHPNPHHGFAYPDLWNRCWGEVFEIYAKGKQRGNYVKEGDDIVLFYPHEKLWLAQGPGKTSKLPCLGTQLPPPKSKYDPCPWETFTILKK